MLARVARGVPPLPQVTFDSAWLGTATTPTMTNATAGAMSDLRIAVPPDVRAELPTWCNPMPTASAALRACDSCHFSAGLVSTAVAVGLTPATETDYCMAITTAGQSWC